MIVSELSVHAPNILGRQVNVTMVAVQVRQASRELGRTRMLRRQSFMESTMPAKSAEYLQKSLGSMSSNNVYYFLVLFLNARF